MTEFITAADLASYLGVDETPAITKIAALTNDLITETWVNPTTGLPPAWVQSIALNVAVRAGANPKGLSSWTRSWDDITRTERMEGKDGGFGVYLTDEEYAALSGTVTSAPAKSIRLSTSWCRR